MGQMELVVESTETSQIWSTLVTPQPGNVKRLFISQPDEGTYTITVLRRFVVDKQKFSLVITGVLEDKSRSSPICCAVGSYPGIGGCLSLDAIICIILSSCIMALVIAAAIVICCRRRQQQAKAVEEEKDQLHPL